MQSFKRKVAQQRIVQEPLHRVYSRYSQFIAILKLHRLLYAIEYPSPS
jgi:hypothetical protein